MSTAQKLHEIAVPLWPLLRPGSILIDIGALPPGQDARGICIDVNSESDRPIFESYLESVPGEHPVHRYLRKVPRPEYLLVLDHGYHEKDGGWKAALAATLHELAHAVRVEVGRSGLFPEQHEIFALHSHVTERMNQLEALQGSEGERASEYQSLVSLDFSHSIPEDSVNVFEYAVFPSDNGKQEPLFGDWASHTYQHGGVHDLLFYLILYLLERKATDVGAFDLDEKINRSCYSPGR